MARGVMIVGTRPVDASREREFNQWYDATHVREMCEIPGIVSGRRLALSEAQMMPADAALHEYLAIYDFDTENVQAMVDELGARMANGTIHLSDVVQLDPLPSVIVYEETSKSA
jgi:hypothetical protein